MQKIVSLFFALSYFFFAFGQNYNYDLGGQTLELWIDPSQLYIKGRVEVNAYLLDSTQVLSLDLNTALTVDSVRRNGQSLSFSHSNNILNIDLGQLLAGVVTIEIFYHGEPESSTPFESVGITTHDGAPVIWTLSEPYGAMDWFPTKNQLGDKIDSLQVIIHTLPQYVAASNGVLVQDTVISDSERVFHWVSHYPIATYLVAFAVTNYSVYFDTAYIADTLQVPIMNFVYPEDLTEAQASTPYAAQCMEFFSERFIPYPFYREKYGHAQFSWGGGMEHQTITFVGGFSQMLLSHELAHQWFGNYITCGSWHEIYLNESFATYLEGLTAEAGLADYTFAQWIDNARRYALYEPGSIYVDDTTNISRIFSYRFTYMKGALMLHQLRWVMGDSAFFAGLVNYLTDSTLVHGFAHTSDLVRNLNKACNCDLSSYFDLWLHAMGYPVFDILVDQVDSHVYSVTISQSDAFGENTFYPLPVPLVFTSSDGQDTVVVLYNTENNQSFTLILPFDVSNVEFDPSHHLLAEGQVSLTTQSEQLDDVGFVKVYPKVFQERINLEFAADVSGEADVILLDLDGKTVYATHVDVRGSRRYSIDFPFLPTGVYVLKVSLASGQLFKTVKLLKL